MQNPVHYRLCRQRVTVYHREGNSVSRRVVPNAFLERRKIRQVDAGGVSEKWKFLLVIPGGEQTVFVGDKIVPGAGPELDGSGWAKLTDCCVAGWAEQKFWDGRAVHTEAGA